MTPLNQVEEEEHAQSVEGIELVVVLACLIVLAMEDIRDAGCLCL